MKIYVLIKQVPDTETKIKLAADGRSIDPAGIKWVMNPYDEFAVEEAIRFKEKNAGANVTVVTLGPKIRVSEVVRTALAMGADEGVVINAPESVSGLVVAKALAESIKREGAPHLIFGGKLAIDDNAASICQQVAEYLALPHATVVSKIEYGAGTVTIEREVEGGSKEKIELKLPAMITTNKGLNTPRYASLPGIMKAKKKPLKELELKDLTSDSTGGILITALSLPAEKPPVQILKGEAAAQVSELVQKLRNEAKVI